MTREPTEMELRCAKAGYERAIQTNVDFPSEPPLQSWENQSDSLKEDWYSIARAVIRVMREPTAEMVAAGRASVGHQFGTDDDVIWRDMIDAALPPDSNEP